ncbi:MAG TPA: galactose-1-phosphate uridylyltransferase [Myxococcales bacterium]|nr:galactose-1-phosphate uridylyltransferase [Myxococcales bacterium]
MPQLRRDPVVGRWVIIAPERANRPSAFLRPAPEHDSGACPFCPGNESMTPPEILSRRENGAWSLRVVPNLYPALRTEIQMSRAGLGLFDSMAGVGAHEVVIETNDHSPTLAELPVAQIESVLQVWQERMIDLSRDVRLKTVVAFKNQGLPAGATLSHAHSQLIALPLVPEALQVEENAARRHFQEKERCIWCDIVAQETRDRERMVLESEAALVLSPWAARSPFELWLLPRDHRSSFESATGNELRAVAEMLRTVLRKIDLALEKPALNLFLHTMPLREPRNDFYHWHLELKPVLTQQAGFEWATGCFINPTAPEEAASFLRQTEVFP